MKKNWQGILIGLAPFFGLSASFAVNTYAGPYSFDERQIGVETCPITSRRCIEVSRQRRRVGGTTNWIYNASIYNIDTYVKDNTTIRILGYTKGSNGRFSNLIDVTKSGCAWMNFMKPLLIDVFNHVGLKYDCYTLLPGRYEMKNFYLDTKKHFKIPLVPALPYGSYKFEARINNDNRINCYCYRLFLEMVPDLDAIRKNQASLRNKTSPNGH